MYMFTMHDVTKILCFLSIGWFYICFAAIGITAGVHRLWSHRSYRAKTPFRILLALMNSAALQVNRNYILKFKGMRPCCIG